MRSRFVTSAYLQKKQTLDVRGTKKTGTAAMKHQDHASVLAPRK